MNPAAATGSAAEPPGDRILVRDLRLWAHVGVLESERQLGQWFELDLELAVDLAAAGARDELAHSLDYSLAITALQQQARSLRCLTLEHFAERILSLLEELYGPVPMRLELRKCRAPVPGFTGTVAVRRSRHGQGLAW
ncbi:dihydroneopterin aldolase [Vulcanococcus limneticus]|uniref:dihydroneopterin aldolase n=1 Tax=Vulcanococcus limneticus TaxID=2170428 RepID=UPI00398BE59B